MSRRFFLARGTFCEVNTRTDAKSTSLTDSDSYWVRSTQPLPVLLFLAPLIALYEVGSTLYLTDPETGHVRETIRAHALFSRFFELFGVGGAMLPGIAMIVVLLIWHVMSRQPWRVRLQTLLMMALESAAWALPLFVLGQAAELAALAAIQGGGRSFGALATIAIGAGLYEELLFRMVAIAAAHFVLVDLCNVKEPYGKFGAIAIAAIAFALYHEDWSTNLIFFLVAGLYFGGLYVYRGFGIVVATHALYDLVVLAL